jgi:hypothetical protein
MKGKPILTKPYNVGDKIKVYIKDLPSLPTTEHTCTYGVVYYVSVTNVPTLRCKNMSDLPLEKFNRFVGMDDVGWVNKPKIFKRK